MFIERYWVRVEIEWLVRKEINKTLTIDNATMFFHFQSSNYIIGTFY